ncbi:MAG TPA: CopG family transcriptional regulator [Actinomycetota bacterium]|nr:CopG family transcriptional regulator [Actinomycetota bacterium]
MKRLHISIDEDGYEALGAEAARRSTSKAALIRQFVRERLDDDRSDPMIALIGDIDDDAGEIDRTIYGT